MNGFHAQADVAVMQKLSILSIFIWVTVLYFCLKLNERGYSWGWRNGACISAPIWSIYERGLSGQPVLAIETIGLEKAFLDREGYDGAWVSGSGCVEVLCIGSSVPSGCRPKVSINIAESSNYFLFKVVRVGLSTPRRILMGPPGSENSSFDRYKMPSFRLRHIKY